MAALSSRVKFERFATAGIVQKQSSRKKIHQKITNSRARRWTYLSELSESSSLRSQRCAEVFVKFPGLQRSCRRSSGDFFVDLLECLIFSPPSMDRTLSRVFLASTGDLLA